MRRQERMDVLACFVVVAGVLLLIALVVAVIYWLV